MQIWMKYEAKFKIKDIDFTQNANNSAAVYKYRVNDHPQRISGTCCSFNVSKDEFVGL